MIKPAEMHCDMCGAHIKDGAKFTKIVLPIPPSIRKGLLEHAEQQILPDMPQRLMLPGLMNADALVPREWMVEVCAGCTTGLLGVALDRMQQQIKEAINQSTQRKHAAEESIDEYEPAHDARL